MEIVKNVNYNEENIPDVEIMTYERMYSRSEFWEEMSKYHSYLLDVLQEESSILEKWGLIEPFFEGGKVFVKIPNFPFLVQLLEVVYSNKITREKRSKE